MLISTKDQKGRRNFPRTLVFNPRLLSLRIPWKAAFLCVSLQADVQIKSRATDDWSWRIVLLLLFSLFWVLSLFLPFLLSSFSTCELTPGSDYRHSSKGVGREELLKSVAVEGLLQFTYKEALLPVSSRELPQRCCKWLLSQGTPFPSPALLLRT